MARRYPAISHIDLTKEAQAVALRDIRQKTDIYERNTDDILNSFVRVDDLVAMEYLKVVGKTLQPFIKVGTLVDVDLTGLDDGYVLAYEQSSQLWKPVAMSGGGGAVDSVNGQTGDVVLELDDIDNVAAPSPNPGDVLTFDGYDWVPEAPSGGSAAPVNPDTHPSSPNAMDDEFEAGSLDGKWTWFQQGTSVVAFGQGALVLTGQNDVGTQLRAITQAVSGAGRWRAKMAYALTGTFNVSGLFMRDSSGGKIITWGPHQDGNNRYQVSKWNSDTSFSAVAFTATLPAEPLVRRMFYYEVELTATNIICRISPDGYDNTFTTVFDEAFTTFIGVIPTDIGLFCGSLGGAVPILVCDWFRKVA